MRRLLVAVMVLGMMLVPVGPASAHGSVDQSFDTGTPGYSSMTTPRCQAFTPTVNNLTGVSLYAQPAGTTADFSVTVRSSSCSGTAVATSTAQTTTGPSWFHFDLGPVALTPANTYYITPTATSGNPMWRRYGSPQTFYFQTFYDPDSDDDGVNDPSDNCVDDPNPGQENYDNDDLGDVCDPDDDNDGTPDTRDAFPMDPDEDTDSDGDGTGNNADPDDDNDGAPDPIDEYPLIFSTCKGLQATHLGTSGPDLLIGTPGVDVFVARGGPDEAHGMGGDDWFCMGTGDDYADGGPGRDRIWGQGGNDLLFGGTQNDRLRGGSGDDVMFGENGKRDRLFGNSGADTADGGNGIADVCVAEAEVACEV